MASSGILTTVRIILRLRETETAYGIFRYSHYGSNHPSTKRKREQATLFSGILINIRIPFGQGNEDVDGILRYFIFKNYL
jgi:hypothetical protein